MPHQHQHAFPVSRPPMAVTTRAPPMASSIPAVPFAFMLAVTLRGGGGGGGGGGSGRRMVDGCFHGGGKGRQVVAPPQRLRIALVAVVAAALLLTAVFGPTATVIIRLSLARRSSSPVRLRRVIDAAATLPERLRPFNERPARIRLHELGTSAVREAIMSKDLDQLYAARDTAEVCFVGIRAVDSAIQAEIVRRDEAARALVALEEARAAAATTAARYADEEESLLAMSAEDVRPVVSESFDAEAKARIAQVRRYHEPLEFQPPGWGAFATYRGETLDIVAGDAGAEEDGGIEATPLNASTVNATNTSVSSEVVPHGGGVLRTAEGIEYAGVWDRGSLSGASVTRWATGSVYYAGERTTLSKKHGLGTLLHHSGEIIHTGRFFNGSARL